VAEKCICLRPPPSSLLNKMAINNKVDASGNTVEKLIKVILILTLGFRRSFPNFDLQKSIDEAILYGELQLLQ
jgi:hypothetical protein